MEATLTKNRRAHERQAMELEVICQTVGLAEGKIFTGRTVDVSAGGALMELHGTTLREGQLISVEMSIPPAEDLSDFGGRISNYARVLRTADEYTDAFAAPSAEVQQVAVEFCDNSRPAL